MVTPPIVARRAWHRALPPPVAGWIGAALAMVVALCVPPSVVAAPRLWKVTRGASTVYLYGGVHLLRPTAVWNTPNVEAALAGSQELWLEIADGDGPGDIQALVSALGLDPDHPLSAKLAEADRTRLAAAERTLGVPPTSLERMRPWLAALSLGLLPLRQAGYDPAAGVDTLLKAEAVRRGLPVKGLETAAQQIHYLADMPPSEEIDFLHQTLADLPDTLVDADRLEAAWQRGDEAAIAALMRQNMSEPLYQTLLVGRNRAFARAIDLRLHTPGVAMVVVGAGHLAGPDSVQAQLRKLGDAVIEP